MVGGFCQGAALALALGLGASTGRQPAGLLFMSGYFADPPGMRYREANGATSQVLAIYGKQDRVISSERHQAAVREISKRGFPVERQLFDMGHQVTLESLATARNWLRGFVDESVV